MATLTLSAQFVYDCELDLAFTYLGTNNDLSAQCATSALSAAIKMGRPDLAYQANEVLCCALGGGL